MVAILLTFEEGPKGVSINQARLDPPGAATDLEMNLARIVDCALRAAETSVATAMSSNLTIIEGTHITDLASKMAKEELVTDVHGALDRAGFKHKR